MAKARIVITQSYQQVASGAVVITVDKLGAGALHFDENQDDSTAYKSTEGAGGQFQQTEAIPTFMRATGDGWEVIVDGVL